MEECNCCAGITYLYSLNCSHQFCMSCIKRVYLDRDNQKCPACTATIDRDFFDLITDHPEKIRKIDPIPQIIANVPENGYVWLYKGRNLGWWLFDMEQQSEIETYFQNAEQVCKILVCGNPITLNFATMTQRNPKNKAKREICRVKKSNIGKYLVKGLSGMK